MALRYWVGGSGVWTNSSTTNWAATSGGAGGATAPVAADSVFFDTNSGTGLVTTSGSVSINAVTISAPGLALQQGALLTVAGAVTITAGSFFTNGLTLTIGNIVSSGTLTRSIDFGTSSISLSQASGLAFTGSNLSFSAGTSTITCNATAPIFAGGGSIFYNVSLANTAITLATITGANTFNTLTIQNKTGTGIAVMAFGANQTIASLVLSTGGNTATTRTFIRSDTLGTPRTLTVAAFSGGGNDYDFRDIVITGTAAPISGTRFGDCGGNSGITFSAAKTVYWNLAAGGSWSATAWATTSGGTPAVANFPLAQDTAIISSTGLTPGNTLTVNAAWNIGTLDMSARNTSNTPFTTSTFNPIFYGSFINGPNVTIAGTQILSFSGRGTQNITSAGKAFTQAIEIANISGSVVLQDALTTSNTVISPTIAVRSGILDLNNYNLTQSGASAQGLTVSSTFGTSEIRLGTGVLTLASSGTAFGNGTGCSVTGAGSISLISASTKTFSGGGFQNYPTINQGGAGTLTISGSNKFANITNTAVGSVLFTGGTTNEFSAFNLNGTSTAARLTLGSSNTTQAILKKPSTWYMGAGSLDSGNTTGLTFSAGGGIDFLNVSYINGQVTTSVSYTGNFFAFF